MKLPPAALKFADKHLYIEQEPYISSSLLETITKKHFFSIFSVKLNKQFIHEYPLNL